MYVNMAQAAMTQRAKLEKLIKGSVENDSGPSNVLHTRDINTESFTRYSLVSLFVLLFPLLFLDFNITSPSL